MIMTSKILCKICQHYGKEKSMYAGWCTYAVNENDKVDFNHIPKRNNLWCMGFEPVDDEAQEQAEKMLENPTHSLAKKLAEEFGGTVRITPIDDSQWELMYVSNNCNTYKSLRATVATQNNLDTAIEKIKEWMEEDEKSIC